MSSRAKAAPPGGSKKQPPLISLSLRHRLSSSFSRIKRLTKGGLAVVGLVTVLPFAHDIYVSKTEEEERKRDRKKAALVLPFHRMRIVEKRDFDLRRQFSSFASSSSEDERPVEIELRSLIDIIHSAAADPDIVALYGTFGKTKNFSVGGLAQVEEIRSAIRVFNESHRAHPEPNVRHLSNHKVPGGGTPKQTIAYSTSFDDMGDNKEYFLASEFQKVYMQSHGSVCLLGLSTSTPFFREAFDKYGIKAHVFKQGKYKNAPNSFSHRGYDHPHLEATKSLLKSLDESVRSGILDSRGLHGLWKAQMWSAIRDYGALTAPNALEVRLIDGDPAIDPLDDFLAYNDGRKTPDAKEDISRKWGQISDLQLFKADHALTLSEYSRTLERRKREKKRENASRWMIHNLLRTLSNVALLKDAMAKKGLVAPFFNIEKEEFLAEAMPKKGEKIAIVYIRGGIRDSLAAAVVKTLRQIGNDQSVKCVVLRIDSPGGTENASESILMECQNLPQPVIASMSNYAASGGYYVAANCHRIFALPTTVTGSIGVFGIKLDLSDFARSYGLNVEHVATGNLATISSPFQPLTERMNEALSRSVDLFYDWFKKIVSVGRSMSDEEIEAVAQGRVWTGAQAKELGLVDELGGLDRAISYAQRTFTVGGNAEVVVWPKRRGFKEQLSGLGNANDRWKMHLQELLRHLFAFEGDVERNVVLSYPDILKVFHGMNACGHQRHFLHAVSQPQIMLTMSEADAINLLLEDAEEHSMRQV